MNPVIAFIAICKYPLHGVLRAHFNSCYAPSAPARVTNTFIIAEETRASLRRATSRSMWLDEEISPGRDI